MFCVVQCSTEQVKATADVQVCRSHSIKAYSERYSLTECVIVCCKMCHHDISPMSAMILEAYGKPCVLMMLLAIDASTVILIIFENVTM